MGEKLFFIFKKVLEYKMRDKLQAEKIINKNAKKEKKEKRKKEEKRTNY